MSQYQYYYFSGKLKNPSIIGSGTKDGIEREIRINLSLMPDVFAAFVEMAKNGKKYELKETREEILSNGLIRVNGGSYRSKSTLNRNLVFGVFPRCVLVEALEVDELVNTDTNAEVVLVRNKKRHSCTPFPDLRLDVTSVNNGELLEVEFEFLSTEKWGLFWKSISEDKMTVNVGNVFHFLTSNSPPDTFVRMPRDGYFSNDKTKPSISGLRNNNPITATANTKLDNSSKFAIMPKDDGIRSRVVVLLSGTLIDVSNETAVINAEKFTVNKDTIDIIFDCERIGDKYLAFDVVTLENVDYHGRLSMAKMYFENFNDSRLSFKSSIIENPTEDQIRELEKMVTSNADKYDGAIVSELSGDYHKTRHYKWKTPDMQTVDLLYKGGDFYAGGQNTPYKTNIEGEFVENCIYEFKVVDWSLVRSRPDKTEPNNIKTVESSITAAKFPIDLITLCTGGDKSSYFASTDNRDEMSALRKSNNYHKRILIAHAIDMAGNPNTVIDLAAGRGADLAKFVDNNIGKIIAIDNDKAALAEYSSRAANKDVKLELIHYDLKNGDPGKISEMVVTENQPSIVSCQMAIHYLNLDLIARVCASTNAKAFVMSYMDGNSVEAILGSSSEKVWYGTSYKITRVGPKRVAIALPFTAKDELYEEDLFSPEDSFDRIMLEIANMKPVYDYREFDEVDDGTKADKQMASLYRGRIYMKKDDDD